MKKAGILIAAIVLGLSTVILLTRLMDARRRDLARSFAEEPLYLQPSTVKRISLGFNGLVADWYWMRTLQYVGRKLIAFEDVHDGRVYFGNLSDLELRLLPSLLKTSTTLDPQFMAPYEYGAMILPEINSDHAIALLDAGVAANPTKWRLYQHLGYVHWTRHDYHKASEVYATGAKLPGAPPWMAAIAARMKAEGGSRFAAGQMYQHLYDSSGDEAVKKMVDKQLMRLDSLDEIDVLRRILQDYKGRNGRCAASWREVEKQLREAKVEIGRLNDPAAPVRPVHTFHLDANGAPLDPSGTPYLLLEKDCDAELDKKSGVPPR